jgi:hypothetical protein
MPENENEEDEIWYTEPDDDSDYEPTTDEINEVQHLLNLFYAIENDENDF